MKPLQSSAARAATAVSAPLPSSRRRRHRRPDSIRLTGSLCAVALLAVALVFYVFGCALVAQHHYRLTHLRTRLRVCQTERRRLEGRAADLLRQERILFLAKQQGMEPRQALQYVKLPQPGDGEFRQASAQP